LFRVFLGIPFKKKGGNVVKITIFVKEWGSGCGSVDFFGTFGFRTGFVTSVYFLGKFCRLWGRESKTYYFKYFKWFSLRLGLLFLRNEKCLRLGRSFSSFWLKLGRKKPFLNLPAGGRGSNPQPP